MPKITTDDGVGLYYEETGEGTPIVFVHEYAGDWRSWELQMRFFGRRYRCITYSARGYTPSDIPQEEASYSQAHAADDIAAVIKGLGLGRAHVVGLSMGAFATLHLGLRHPELARSLTAAGVGYGADPAKREQFKAETEANTARIKELGMDRFGAIYARGPTRLVYEEKDPRGFAEFERQLREHDTTGSYLTQRGVQLKRPSLFDLKADFEKLALPTFIVAGDEDDPTLEASIYLKRTIKSSALLVMPKCGHTMNIEDPDAFNRAVLDFITHVDAGTWRNRIPASQSGGIVS